MVNYNSTSHDNIKISSEDIQITSDLEEIRLDDPTSSTVDTVVSSSGKLKSCKQWFECNLLSCFEGNKEVIACCLIKIPEACFMATSSIFLSTAFIKIATVTAGCDVDAVDDCDKRIYGLKPSSMLTITVMIHGIVGAIIMPLVGALIDSSNFRRGVGAISALILSVLTFIQSFLSERIWFPMMMLNLLGAIAMKVNTCVALAYLPELSKDDKKRAKFNTLIQMSFNITMVIFLVGMTITSSFLKGNTIQVAIQTAKIALLITFALQVMCYGVAWTRLFSPRSASKASQLERILESSSSRCILLISGLRSLKRTLFKIFRQRPEVRSFLFFRAVSQPALYSVSATIISYLNERIDLSSRDLGITVMIVLVLAIPGNWFSNYSMNRFSPLLSLRSCMIIWSILPLLFALSVTKPGHEPRLFALASLWGILVGWKEPVDKTILCACVPKGIEAEMMGLYEFASTILSWFPPLLFTLMNENGIDMRYGLSAFGGFFLLGVLSLSRMGDYNAVITATKTHEQDEFNVVALKVRAVSENDLMSMNAEITRHYRISSSSSV